jgi:hypothetical protein
MSHILRLFTIVFLTSGVAMGQTTTQADITGVWNMEVKSTAGTGTPVFDLKHTSATVVTGTYKGRLGDAAVKGTVKGNVIHLEFSINDTRIEYDGTVEGDTAKGTIKFGKLAEGTFTGARKK